MPDDKSVITPIDADFDDVARSMLATSTAPVVTGPTPVALVDGFLPIGGVDIPCAVLDDIHNTRVLTQEGFLKSIGRAGKAKGGEGSTVDGMPPFLRAKNLIPFITSNLIRSTFQNHLKRAYPHFDEALQLSFMDRLTLPAPRK